jgi:hypothetical protein
MAVKKNDLRDSYLFSVRYCFTAVYWRSGMPDMSIRSCQNYGHHFSNTSWMEVLTTCNSTNWLILRELVYLITMIETMVMRTFWRRIFQCTYNINFGLC